MLDRINEAATYIRKQYSGSPKVALILGSGLGVLADKIEQPVKIPYETIPHFPLSTVEGHAGQLVMGTLMGKEVIAMQGRFHYYEGYSFNEVTFPVRVMKAIGVEDVIITNAAGGVNEQRFSVRFPDMSNAYNKEHIQLVKDVANNLKINVQTGVYVGNTGPVYETPAEVRMIRTLGGDAVGMSTVPEVIVAVHSGMKVIGISCISNMAAGILDQPLSHDEVIETTEKVRTNFLQLIEGIVKEL